MESRDVVKRLSNAAVRSKLYLSHNHTLGGARAALDFFRSEVEDIIYDQSGTLDEKEREDIVNMSNCVREMVGDIILSLDRYGRAVRDAQAKMDNVWSIHSDLRDASRKTKMEILIENA